MALSAAGDTGRPIRLTYLITDLEVGGVPLHLYRLATRLASDRFRVRVISLAGEGPVGTMLRRAGIPVFTCGASSAWDAGALWRLWRLLQSDRPDILHALLFHANTAARVVAPLVGLPISRIICEIQTVEQERRWHLVVDNLTCRLCRCEVGNSPSVLEHLHARAHLPRSRLRCELGAVDLEAVVSAEAVSRASLGLPDDEPILIWTGRFDPVKGFEEMLAAFARLGQRRAARLVLVGDGPYRQTVERLIRDMNLSSRVLLTGQRHDVPALLGVADLFVFCSRTEGLPNSLLEAMAAALPIVAVDVPGCRDLILPGKTGLLVPAGDVEAIAQAWETLLASPDRARALGQGARAWVAAHADVRGLVQRWAACYQSMP